MILYYMFDYVITVVAIYLRDVVGDRHHIEIINTTHKEDKQQRMINEWHS